MIKPGTLLVYHQKNIQKQFVWLVVDATGSRYIIQYVAFPSTREAGIDTFSKSSIDNAIKKGLLSVLA